MSFNLHIRRVPSEETSGLGAGAGTTPPAGSTVVAGVPVDRTVADRTPTRLRVGDREYDSAAISQLQKDHAEMQTALKTLYAESPGDPEQVYAAAAVALRVAGQSEPKIKETIDGFRREEAAKGKEPAAPKADEPRKLTEYDQLTASIVNERIEQAASKAITDDPTLKELVEAVARHGKKEDGEQFRKSVTEEVLRNLRIKLGEVRRASGGLTDIRIVDQTVAPILDEVLTRYKPMVAMARTAKRAGPSPIDPFVSVREKAPLEMPVVDPKRGTGDNLRDVEAFVKDRLARIIMKNQDARAMANA